MSLLSRATDVVTVFPEEAVTDSDGNTKTRASAVGIVAKAVVQPMVQFVGSEKAEIGFETEERLRLRLVGWQGGELGAQSQVEWQGRRYSIHGEPRRYGGSRRTAHVIYQLVRK
ncbi:hypothetical protein [Mycolicibacterium psychrotolerans]|uniref:Head-to-tail stopper n=1 Tax=Mycolicibacterium psychrotolerans TaxID=216929 RepID=A0A7I7MDG0_9MYCO|nr:hypothetical protein [Mycolicibacterium psychrotolerans]BBX69419.1 hypothetical protein MPSYJ_28800 [Mycolicibacterium psychrotolerans]